MSLRKKLVSSSALNLVDYAVRIGAVFFVSPFLIGELGKDGYGYWVVLVSVIGYLNLLDLGLSQTALRYFSRALGANDHDEYARLYRFFLRFYAAIAAVSVLFTLAGVWSVSFFVSRPEAISETRTVLLIGGMTSSLTYFLRVNRALIRSHVLYHRSILAGTARMLVYTAGIFVLLPRYSGIVTMASLWSAGLIVEQLCLFLGSRDLRPKRVATQSLSPTERKSILHFASKLLSWSLAGFLRNRVDSQILAAWISTESVTQYSIGTRFINMFTDVLNAVFGGHFLAGFSQVHARDGDAGAAARLLDTLRVSAPLSLAGGTAIMLIGPPFIDRWLGPGFEQAHLVILILTIPATLKLMQYPLPTFLGARDRHGLLATGSLLGGALNLVGSLILVQYLGFIGVIVSTALEVSLTSLFFLPWLAVNRGGIPLRQYAGVFLGTGWKLIPAILASVLLCAWLRPASYLSLGITGAGIGLLFGVSSWLLILRSEERRYLMQSFDRRRSTKRDS